MTNMNCLCGGGAGDTEAVQRNKELTRKLIQWQKEEERIVKILMLGTGESGKTTITKQMKIIHINGFSDSERRENIPAIRKNLKDSILTICGAMCLLHVPLENPSLQPCIDYLMATAEDTTYSEDFYHYTQLLWQDAGVRECYRRANEYQLVDCAKYFLDRLDVLKRDDYLPTDQDILRCRVVTNSIHRIDFNVDDNGSKIPFSVIDVGGQRGERRKWISVFDGASAILFVLDCSSFDNGLREDHFTNRLVEAAEIFEQVWNNRYLRDVSIILFINKIDLLEEKINEGKTLDILLERIPKSNPYYRLFSSFSTSPKPTKDERREFLEQFPHHSLQGSGGTDPTLTAADLLKRRKSRSAASLLPQRHVNDEVVRTAVFIKNVFLSLLHTPCQYRQQPGWHDNHTCEYFYTCAVDTHTIRKVLEGMRSVILKKHLDKIGINLFT